MTKKTLQRFSIINSFIKEKIKIILIIYIIILFQMEIIAQIIINNVEF